MDNVLNLPPMLIGGTSRNEEAKAKALENIKYIYASYDQSGNSLNTDFLDAGNESGLFVNGAMPNLPVIGDPEYNNNLTSNDIAVDKSKVKETTTQTSLIGRMKENQDSTNQRLDVQNNLLEQQNKLAQERNKIEAMKIDELKKQTAILDATAKATATGVIDNQSFISHANSANMTQARKNNFELNGAEQTKNTNGEKIIPAVEKAKYHSEKRIDEERANTTDIRPMLDTINSSFGTSDGTGDGNENGTGESGLDINIMNTVFNKMFGNIDFNNLPANLQEIVNQEEIKES